MIEHGFHDGGENSFRDRGTGLDGVGSISENLWLDDWDKSVVLADGSISSQSVGSLIDGELTWHSVANLENCSPLGKSASFFVESFCSSSKSI